MKYLTITAIVFLTISLFLTGCAKKDDDDGNGGGGGGGGGTTAFQVDWTKIWGAGGEDYGNCVRETSDGGFILACGTGPLSAPRYFTLIKTDASGNETWLKDFAGNGYSEAKWVEQTSDGGYIAVGYTTTSPYDVLGYQILLIKTDASGNETWSSTLGESNYDCGNCVRQTSDGGYIVAGTTKSLGEGAGDLFLLKTDADGAQTWFQNYNGLYIDHGNSVVQTTDGGYCLVGDGGGVGGIDYSVIIIKTNSSGVASWTQTLNNDNLNYGNSVIATTDGYAIVGETDLALNFCDAFLLKTDASGVQTWAHNFGSTNFTDRAKDLVQVADGYIFVGQSSNDFYIVKTNLSGAELFNLKIPSGDVAGIANCIDTITGGGYIIVGNCPSQPSGAADMNIKLVKITEI